MFKIKKILPSLTLVVLLFGWLIMSTTQTASAADPAAITADGSQINYQGATYTNSGLTDTNNQPLFVASDFQCGGKLIVASTNNSYTLITSAGSGGLGSGCTLTTGGEVTLDVYKVETQDDCEGIGADWQSNKCTFNDSTDATSFAASASGEGGNLTNGEGSCEDEGGEFSFFLCPALRIATDMFEELDYQIRSALEVKPKYYQDSQLKQAWARIRNVAYVLLIPVMLFMVIGTALGFNFLDAYTVKRALPRMFAAIIFMALSYDVCRIMIDITNGVGRGAGGLIAQPFGGLDSLRLQDIFNAGAVNGASALGGGALGVVVLFAIGALSLGILASYFFTASLALLVVFIVLSVRELIIVFLIILAPLAILAWIFPGNDKMWKLWWGTFTKLLFLYPLIVGLLVTGRAFAKIAGTLGATGIEGVFIILVKLTAYVGPFFFIPKAFQFAGNAFGNLAGMINDRGKGLFDRQTKYRENKRKELGHAARGGHRFKNAREGSMLGKINTLTEKSYMVPQAGVNPRNWKRNINQAATTSTNIEAQQFAEKNEAFSQFKNDDDILKAAEFREEEQIRAALIRHGGARFRNDVAAQDQAIALVRRAQQGASWEAFQRARVGALPGTGTAYQYAYDENGDVIEDEVLDRNGVGTGVFEKRERADGVDLVQMMKDINGAYGEDRAGAGGALARARTSSVQSGQVLAGKAGYATMAGQMGRLYTNRNIVDGIQRDLLEADARNIVRQDAIDSSSPGEALYGKPASAAGYAQGWADRIDEITRQMRIPNSGVTFDDLARAIASTGGLLDAAGQAAPQNAREMERVLQSMQVDLTGLNIPGMAPGQSPVLTVRQLIDNQAFGSAAHQGMRRDYATAATADAANRQLGAAIQAGQPLGGAPPPPPGGLPPSVR